MLVPYDEFSLSRYRKKCADAIKEIRELIGDANGAVSSAAIKDILERYGVD